jgi:uncharacterized protein YcbK (DUF882 family)
VSAEVHKGSPLFPEPPQRHRIHRGLVTERQEHIFTWVAVIVVLLYATAWISAIVNAARAPKKVVTATPQPQAPTRRTAEPSVTSVFVPESVPVANISDSMLQFLAPLRGESGALRYAPVLPGEAIIQDGPQGARVITEGEGSIQNLAVEINRARRAIEDLSVVQMVPIARKRNGRIGTYHLGSWPWEQGGTPRSERYAAPEGFIEVTQQNQNFYVSEHFQLRDFLTKDQRSVWPKYLLLDPLLIDKLELTIQELKRQGVRVQDVHVMSGFRTPRYNAGGGNTAGRANLSRHMYGDGADVYVDNNRDGQPDDITGDGRVTTADAEKFARAAERVEQKYRGLVGGIGIYSACCGHGPFTHVDVRGARARWRGSGSG